MISLPVGRQLAKIFWPVKIEIIHISLRSAPVIILEDSFSSRACLPVLCKLRVGLYICYFDKKFDLDLLDLALAE